MCSGGFFAGKVASLSDRVEGRFDPGSRMGAMYRARYLNDGYFEALKLLKEVAVSIYPIQFPVLLDTYTTTYRTNIPCASPKLPSVGSSTTLP